MTAASVESFATAAAVARTSWRGKRRLWFRRRRHRRRPLRQTAAVAPVASAETRGAGLRIVRGRTRRFFGPPRSPFSRRKFESAKRDDDDIELFDYSIRINPKA